MDTQAVADLRTLWFLNTRVAIRISALDGADGISVLEHRASFGDSPPLHIHHDEDEIFHVLEGTVPTEWGRRSGGPGPARSCSRLAAFPTRTEWNRLRARG